MPYMGNKALKTKDTGTAKRIDIAYTTSPVNDVIEAKKKFVLHILISPICCIYQYSFGAFYFRTSISVLIGQTEQKRLLMFCSFPPTSDASHFVNTSDITRF